MGLPINHTTQKPTLFEDINTNLTGYQIPEAPNDKAAMPSPQESPNAPSLPHLPSELLIHILSFLPAEDLHFTIRHLSPTLRHESEKLLIAKFLPTTTLSLTYSLGSGTRHRWYDVRATITLSFDSIDKHNPDFALFKVSAVYPPNYFDRALEKWRPMCAKGLGEGLDWKAAWDGVTREVGLRKVVASEDGSLWCDWRELMRRWFTFDRVRQLMGFSDETR